METITQNCAYCGVAFVPCQPIHAQKQGFSGKVETNHKGGNRGVFEPRGLTFVHGYQRLFTAISLPIKERKTARFCVFCLSITRFYKKTCYLCLVENDLRYEIQNLLSGNESFGQGNLIQTAAYYLSRSQSTGGNVEKPEFSKREEEKQLVTWIEQEGLWQTPPDEVYYLTEGAEQKVYVLLEENSVLKINSTIFYASWLDYFHSLLLHNYFFPTTTYTLLGFLQNDEGLCAVVKQPFVRISTPTDLEAVKAFLEANGFTNTRNNDYINTSLGIILEDLHDENVLTYQDTLFVVDSVFYLTPEFYRQG